MGVWLSGHKSSTSTASAVVIVETSELLEEDEGEDGVRSESGVVWRKPFPETKEPFLLDQLTQHLL